MSKTRPTGNALLLPPAAPSAPALPAGLLQLPAARASSRTTSTRGSGLGSRINASGGLGHRTCPAAQVEAAPAARLVDLGAAHDDAAALLHLAIGAVRRGSADDADRQRLRDVLRDREQLGHRVERPPEVVLVEPRDDHALAHLRELLAHADEPGPQELALVDADHLRLVRVPQHGGRLPDAARGNPDLAVRHDRVLRVAVVDRGLEDLDALAGDLCAAQAADQLLGLAAVHAADDDFDRSGAARGG